MGRAKDSAEMTAFGRAAGTTHLEGHPLKNPDHLARLFLGTRLGLMADLCRIAPVRSLLDLAYERIAPGAGRYLLARTKHFDQILLGEIAQGLGQLVLLGAGYDTRAYRFRDRLAGTKVFELDHPDTAARKRLLLRRIYGALPEEVTFVSIDFAVESLQEKLLEAGFDRTKRTFFLWEGVSYYLTEPAVDAVLAVMTQHSPPGSALAFDYMDRTVVDGTSTAYGAVEIANRMRRGGEPFYFGIEEGGAERFLARRGFRLLSAVDSAELDRRYLTGQNGKRYGRVSGFFGIAHAKVMTR